MINNKTVIISCAGIGKRLGIGKTKALVEIDDIPLIVRTINMLKDVSDVRIVVGFQAEEVINVVSKYRKDILYVFNHDYMNNGTGASVSLATKYAKEYVLTIDGDLLLHPDDMKDLLNDNDEFVGVTKIGSDNPVKTTIDNGNVVKFSREEGQFEWTGVCQVKSERLKPGLGHVYQLIEDLLPLKSKYIRTKEIDTMNDYDNAVKWVRNNYSD